MKSRSLLRRLAILIPLLASCLAHADGQSVEVRLDVPGLGEPVANGLYLFKFAIVDGSGSQTLWSNDGTSVDGREPDGWLMIPVSNGRLIVILGEPPISGQPPIDAELLERSDVLLRTWVSNGIEPRFRRLSDQRLRGRGFAHAAEEAKNAQNAQQLQGLTPDAFEIAGAVWRHESLYVHTPVGSIPGGRLYHGSSDLGAGRELAIHFSTPGERSQVTLALHGRPSTGPPAITDLRMHTARADNAMVGETKTVVDIAGAGWLAGIRTSWDYCDNCFKRKDVPATRVTLDGAVWEGHRSHRASDAPGPLGRTDDLSMVGLVRFQRSLKVTVQHQGIDTATGTTMVWYYTTDDANDGAPGAVRALLDGHDFTNALLGRSEVSRSMRPAADRMLVSRYDGATPNLDAPLDLPQPADKVWLARAVGVDTEIARESAVLLDAYVMLGAGSRRLEITSNAATAVELLDPRRHRVTIAEGGVVEVGDEGWHRLRVLAAAPPGRLTLSFTVDGRTPRVRTEPLLGGAGDEGWSLGPIDLRSLQLTIPSGEHVLIVRNRGERNGHIEYSVLVE